MVFGPTTWVGQPSYYGKLVSMDPWSRSCKQRLLTTRATFPSALPARRESDHAAWLTIQIGCDNTCAFCIVPAVRGPEISRPFTELVREAEAMAADGVIEITLLGQNVNSYGRDLTLGLRSDDAGHRRRGARRINDGLATLAAGLARYSPTCCAMSALSPAFDACGTRARIQRTSAKT